MAVTLGDIAMGNGRHNEFHQFGADDVNKAIYAGQTLGDLAERNRERARQQSVRNLIGQRMKEGYDWTQLGAEAAQFSPETARTMDNQFMQEGTWQRNENVENLKQFREEMTRRKFSEALNTFMQGGYAISREEFMTMCERAAANVAMYDANLAKELLQWIKSEIDAGAIDRQKRDIAEAKKAERRMKDDDVKLGEFITKAREISTTTMDATTKNLLAADVNRANYLKSNLRAKGYPIYMWMLSYLKDSTSNEDAVRQLIASYDENAPVGFEYGVNADKTRNDTDSYISSNYGNQGGNSSTTSTMNLQKGTSTAAEKSTDHGDVGNYVHTYNTSVGEVVKPVDVPERILKRAAREISEASTLNELDAIASGLDQLASANSTIKVDALKDSLKKKRSDIESLSKDGIPYNNATKVLLDKMPARANASNIRRLRQAGTAAAGLISTTPWSIMDNLIMVQSPDFAPTNAMQGTAAQVLDGSSWQSAITSFQNSGNSFAANLAKNSNVWKALESGARDLLNTIRPMYKEMLENCKTEKEKAALKSMLSSTTYGWPPQLFDALEDENYGSLGTAEEIRKRVQSLKDKPVNQYFADEVVTKEGKTVKRNDKETSSKPSNESSGSPKVMSAKEWLARRRAQKEGR